MNSENTNSIEAARQMLGVADDAVAADIERACEAKLAELRQRIDTAPTAALGEKYRHQAENITRAADLLYTQLGTADHNFPSVRPLGEAAAPPVADAGNEDGKFTLGEKITDTPWGSIFRARESSGDEVALYAGQGATARNYPEVFRAGAEASKRYFSPNAGGATDMGSQDGSPYFTLKPLHGQLLRTELDEAKRVRRQLPVEQSLKSVGALARALSAAHPGFVHGDIRPETVWLCPDGSLRLLGFAAPRGAARAARPEDDQAQLAGLLWEMLAGKPPSALRENLRSLRNDVGTAAAQAVEKAMQPEAQNRFSD